MITIKDILIQRLEEEIAITRPIKTLLHLKYGAIIDDLQNNCTHKWEDGSSALKHMIDDYNEYNENPTYEEWDLCEICDKVFEC